MKKVKELEKMMKDNPKLPVKFICMIEDDVETAEYEFEIYSIKIGDILYAYERMFDNEYDLQDYIEAKIWDECVNYDDVEFDTRVEDEMAKYEDKWIRAIIVYMEGVNNG